MKKLDAMILSIIAMLLILVVVNTSCATHKPSKTNKVGVKHEAFLLPSNYY